MLQSSVTILAYHRIAAPGTSDRDLSPTLIDAYPADFERQMRHVAGSYNLVSTWDIVRAIRDGRTLPKRAMAITFDDGYACFRDAAMPVLRRLGVPVTLFVSTCFAENPTRLFWWDMVYRSLVNTTLPEISIKDLGHFTLGTKVERMRGYECVVENLERRGSSEAESMVEHIIAECGVEANTTQYLLGWDDVEALASEGVTIGPHTRTHPILAQAPPERVRDEIEGSWRDLSEHIAKPLPIFCYPNGQTYAINRSTRQMAANAGLVGAVTMLAGLNVPGRTDPFLMHRIGVVAGESLAHFQFKISAAGRIYRRMKAVVKRNPALRFDI